MVPCPSRVGYLSQHHSEQRHNLQVDTYRLDFSYVHYGAAGLFFFIKYRVVRLEDDGFHIDGRSGVF